MATKTKSYALNGAHTAGIFADMSVDGPIIGTLVAIVDRAKNLPNRKTIGKQDPYCAARLGKEAKKTTTDIRGGQTPKWDQELRFTVHDSPDYYQLKMSVFTDDKKTDLIGESWIDLKGIIVPGGGQNDMWQGLTCRGKYAGEIRVEITFYDTRPRPEKPAAKQRQQTATEQDATGSAKPRTPVKRRPLPSDPVTGEAPVTPPAAVASQPEAHQHHAAPRSHSKSASHSGFVPNQSPLQSVEYSTPPHPQGVRQQPEYYTPSPHSAHRHAHRPRESYGAPARYQDDRGFSQRAQPSPYDQPDSRSAQGSFTELHELPPEIGSQPPFEDEAPPPPPAHRSRQNSVGPEVSHRGSYDVSPQKSPVPMRKDVLKSEAHRHSIAAYPGQPVFKPYDPTSSAPIPIASRNDSPYESPSSRYQSQSPGYSPQHRSMQPTVEDVPDSPSVSNRHSSRAAVYQSEMALDAHASQMPQSAIESPVHTTPRDRLQDYGAYPTAASPLSVPEYSNTLSQVSQASQSSHQQRPGRHSDFDLVHIRNPASYGTPAVPPSLSPGVDLALSQEFADRRYEDRGYEDRRYESRYTQPTATPPRGRHRSEGPPSYTTSPHSYTPQSHDGRAMVTYSSRPEPLATKSRNSPSPNPNPEHTIRRKSVSPAPPPSENRRQSDVPFGPDSYDAFNPAMGSPGAADSRVGRVDPNAKIITHDGREIDPSDHLPMETWAPEPEPRGKQTSPEPRARPSPSGAQPMPPSGRRTLRIAARPDSVITQQQQQQQQPPPPSYSQAEDPRTPPTGGRNRLQKKARASAGHNSLPPSASSPLAPISPDNYQGRQVQYTPTRGAHPGGPYDYPNENHAPPHYGSGPPLPAKIPLPIMSGANGGGELALVEEMQRIDIGAGRSRRRGGY
ncbi:Ingression protein fic1 [Metarhizium anisopliae]